MKMKLTVRLVALIFSLFTVTCAYSDISVYAHRGGRALWPENTLIAYKHALALGIDFVDLDVNLTKDRVYVVTHDLTLNPALTRDQTGQWINKKLPINQLTVEELKTYNVGQIRPDSDYAKRFPSQQAAKLAKIPTLLEAIQFVKQAQHKQTGFQIEVKTPFKQVDLVYTPEVYASRLYKILKNEAIINISEIQSFDFRVLNALRKLDLRLKLAYLSDKAHVEYLHKQLSWPVDANSKPLSLPQYVARMGGQLWEPDQKDLTRSQIEEAHQLGLKVVVWGFADQEHIARKEIARAIKIGVDGIITDHPHLMAWIKTL